jgi:hypothetical protein
LDNAVVFQFVIDAMADTHPGVIIFLWNSFLALRGRNAPEIPKTSRPKMVYLVPDCECDFEITPKLAASIITLLKSYFETAKKPDNELGAAILDHIAQIPDQALTEKWFDLAKAIGPSEKIAQRACKICCALAPDIRLCERSLSYLAVGAAVLDLKMVERALLRSIMDERITNIGLGGWLNIVRMYCPPVAQAAASRGQWQLKEAARDPVKPKAAVAPEIRDQFQNDMTSILAFLWSKFRPDGLVEKVKRSFVMEAAALIDEPPGPISRWKDFRQWVLLWKNREANWSTTVFDGELFTFSGGWKQDLIESLQKATPMESA